MVVVHAAEGVGARLVFLSVAGASPHSPMELFRAKYAAEQSVRSSDLAWTIIRPDAFADLWIQLLTRTAGRPHRPLVFGPGSNPTGWVAVRDVTALTVRAVETPSLRGSCLTISGPQRLTATEFASRVMAAQHWPGTPRHVPIRLLHVASTLPGSPAARPGPRSRWRRCPRSSTTHAGQWLSFRAPRSTPCSSPPLPLLVLDDVEVLRAQPMVPRGDCLASRRAVAAGVDVVDAGPRRGSRLQPCGSNRLVADLAVSVGACSDAFESCFDFEQVVVRLARQRRQLGPFVGDRLPLGVVFVIGVGVARGRDQGGHLVGELRGARAEGIAFLVEPGNRLLVVGLLTTGWCRRSSCKAPSRIVPPFRSGAAGCLVEHELRSALTSAATASMRLERRFHCCQCRGTSRCRPGARSTSSPVWTGSVECSAGSMAQPRPRRVATAKSAEAGT